MNKQQLEEAFKSKRPLDSLRAVVRDWLAHGKARETVYAELTSFVLELRETGREEEEDLVLDLMDFLAPWSEP